MGKRNRERRAAKQRKRASGQGPTRVRHPRPEWLWDADDAVPVVALIDHAARRTAQGQLEAAGECAEQLCGAASLGRVRAVELAAGLRLRDLLAALWDGGWQPRDLFEVTRRRLRSEHVSCVSALIAEDTVSRSAATLDHRWLEQVTEIAEAVPRSPSATLLGAWGARRAITAVAALTAAIEVLAMMSTVPRLELLIPRPGSAGVAHAGRHPEPANAKSAQALARVRSLLAKAESTEFPEEADALSAKAQELMARHSLERLVEQSAAGVREPVSARRLWLDAPYAGAKALLVQVVSEANRCRAVWAQDLGFVTVVGDERDLVATELMSTSLLVQATRAMVERGSQSTTIGRPRSRSFRQSFLVAYANRIGQRLQGASAEAVADLGGADLLPVLVADDARIAAATEAMFPTVVSRTLGVSSSAGWAAGQVAADLALFDTGRAISDSARASA